LVEFARLPAIERIDLVRLSRDEIAEQLAGILGSAPGVDLVRRIYERSEGNPFFAEELLAAGVGGPLPDTLRDALLLRIEALPEGSRQLLRILAAAGRPVLGELLAAAAQTTEEAVSAAMREAVGQHVVSVTDDQHFRFRHALFGEAAYDDLLPGERVRVHHALAQALAAAPRLDGVSESIAAAELAHHWLAAQAIPEGFAATTAAGLAARSAGAYAEAVQHLSTALELWDKVPDAQRRAGVSRGVILGRAGRSAHLAGDYDVGIGYLTRAVDALVEEQDHAMAALAQTWLGRCFWAAGRSDDAIAAHARAVELAPSEPTAERAQVLAMMARVLMVSDRIAQSLPIAEEALSIARAISAREAEGHALNTIGIDVAELGDRERGITILRRALAIAQELGFPDELGSSYVNISDQIDQAGRIEEAAELAIEGMRASERAGAVRLHGAFLAAEAASRLTRLSRYDDAERLVADALTRNAGGRTRAALHQRRAQILIERGQPAAAEHALEVARRTIDFTISQWIGPQGASEVEAALWLGEPDRAASIARDFLARLGDGFFANLVAPLHAHALRAEADRRLLARARGEVADEPECARLLRAGLTRLTGPGAGAEVHAWVALAHAEAARAEGATRSSAFADAADRFGALAMPFRTAYARLREAEAGLEEGARRDEVGARLQQALGLAAGIGASLLVAEIEKLARRGRVPLIAVVREAPAADVPPAPFGLTARELEVLVLVAQGHTNKEIGSRLYMSAKTASAHVSHILEKLAARNRGEAAAIAVRLGLDAGSPGTAP
jgi:DNA-binding CsgD family transcriptional regulator/tetratricopeptide (TPR) repeat protein